MSLTLIWVSHGVHLIIPIMYPNTRDGLEISHTIFHPCQVASHAFKYNCLMSGEVRGEVLNDVRWKVGGGAQWRWGGRVSMTKGRKGEVLVSI